MESLLALGVAANVIQFVDFGRTLLRDVKEICESVSGSRADYVELEEICQNLSTLESSLTTSSDASSAQPGGAAAFNPSQEIRKAAQECQKIAGELGDLLRNLRVAPDHKYRRWKALLKAIEGIWGRSKITEMRTRLDSMRAHLSLQIQLLMSEHQRATLVQLASISQDLKSLGCRRNDEIRTLTESLRTLRLESNKGDKEIGLVKIASIKEVITEALSAIKSLRGEESILRSLDFSSRSDREEAVKEAHAKTFDWIFQPQSFLRPDPRADIKFIDWLASEDSHYWISGKPGSGKSTLMKYLCRHPATRAALAKWSGSAELIIVGYFFWIGGNSMQRSLVGLLRALLLEIFKRCPHLIRTTCAQRVDNPSQSTSWSLSELRNCFAKLDTEILADFRFCFFIDGLDEYEGDPVDLRDVVQTLSQTESIKICSASRPWKVFSEAFGQDSAKRLFVEHLTKDDIATYAKDRFKRLSGVDDRARHFEFTALVEEITKRAQGVFLWVNLVVRSLMNGFVNGDDLQLLHERLLELPTELEPFFERIISSVDQVYQQRMAITFLTMLSASDGVPLFAYAFLGGPSLTCLLVRKPFQADRKHSTIRRVEDQLRNQIAGRYQGLLEVAERKRWPQETIRSRQDVHFLHRTFRDYLMTSHVNRMLHQRAGQTFNAALCGAKAFVDAARTFPQYVSFHKFSNECMEFAKLSEELFPSSSNDVVLEMCEVYLSHCLDGGKYRFVKWAIEHDLTRFVAGYVRRFPRVLTEMHILLSAALERLRDVENRPRSPADMVEILLSAHLKAPLSSYYKMTIRSMSLLFNDVFLSVCRKGDAANALGFSQCWRVFLGSGADPAEIFTATAVTDRDSRYSTRSVWYSSIITDRIRWTEVESSRGDNLRLEVMTSLFDHGLNPNAQLGPRTLWEHVLIEFVFAMNCHGLSLDSCVALMIVFLKHGADPFIKVRVRWEMDCDRIPAFGHLSHRQKDSAEKVARRSAACETRLLPLEDIIDGILIGEDHDRLTLERNHQVRMLEKQGKPSSQRTRAMVLNRHGSNHGHVRSQVPSTRRRRSIPSTEIVTRDQESAKRLRAR